MSSDLCSRRAPARGGREARVVESRGRGGHFLAFPFCPTPLGSPKWTGLCEDEQAWAEGTHDVGWVALAQTGENRPAPLLPALLPWPRRSFRGTAERTVGFL